MADNKGGVGDWRVILATGIAGALRPLILAVGLGWISSIAGDALKAFAGKASYADLKLAVSMLANTKFELSAAVALTGSGWAYGLAQRKLRRNTVERLQGRITDLEQAADPKRTSSHLTKRGATRKEDKL